MLIVPVLCHLIGRADPLEKILMLKTLSSRRTVLGGGRDEMVKLWTLTSDGQLEQVPRQWRQRSLACQNHGVGRADKTSVTEQQPYL